MAIRENVKTLLEELPDGVELVGAAKGRTAREIEEAIDAGLKIVGENYIQETLLVQKSVNKDVEWHFIKVMPVLVEVNSGREEQKSGVLPEDVELPDVEMRYLSMGMTNSYRIALEEGANMVRIGTKIFGERR
jgi:hypothetical protein